jgi:hypothetical protein
MRRRGPGYLRDVPIFFQRQPDRLDADPIDKAQDDQLVGQQLQGPMAAPLGGLAAGQLDQPLLEVPFDLDLVRPRGLPSATQGRVEALGDQLSADARDGPQTGPQSGDDLLVGALLAARIVGEQQDSGVGRFAGRRLAAGDQPLQLRSLLRRQSDPILVYRGHPVLEVSLPAGHQAAGYSLHLPNEDG